jgi:hypothetical protein
MDIKNLTIEQCQRILNCVDQMKTEQVEGWLRYLNGECPHWGDIETQIDAQEYLSRYYTKFE